MESDDSVPVDPGEFVLRRIHMNHYFPTQNPPITVEAFRPSSEDDNGLSVYREGFNPDPQQVLQYVEAAKRDRYYVVRIAVRDILAMGLTVVADHVPGEPGHALIPEIALPVYTGKRKAELRPAQLELARLAADAIVVSPPTK